MPACFCKDNLIWPTVNAEYVRLYIKVSYSSKDASFVSVLGTFFDGDLWIIYNLFIFYLNWKKCSSCITRAKSSMWRAAIKTYTKDTSSHMLQNTHSPPVVCASIVFCEGHLIWPTVNAVKYCFCLWHFCWQYNANTARYNRGKWSQH